MVLTRFVRFLVYFEDIEQITGADSTRRSKYAFNRLTFGTLPIENPLLFLEDFAKDDDSNAKTSAWMLNQVAFSRFEGAE